MNPKRKLMLAERERKARVRRIRRECFEITRLSRGRWRLNLILDHQSFPIAIEGRGPFTSSKKSAWWHATKLAIALNRFKYGD